MQSFQYGRSGQFPDHTLRVNHVSEMLGVPQRTIRWWAETGFLEAVKNGPRIWCFRPCDVDAFWRRLSGATHSARVLPPSATEGNHGAL
jgi:excisionase family DNA binding protein